LFGVQTVVKYVDWDEADVSRAGWLSRQTSSAELTQWPWYAGRRVPMVNALLLELSLASRNMCYCHINKHGI
jgi:hypothetical protein